MDVFKPIARLYDMMKEYTKTEVSKHCTPRDGWIIIDAAVYDVSKFYDLHPGSSGVLDPYLGGKIDATDDFFGLHRSSVLKKYARLKIGSIKDDRPQYVLPEVGALSVVPGAEPSWLVKGFKSPYFDDSHRALQKEVRKFFDEHVAGAQSLSSALRETFTTLRAHILSMS